MDSSSNLVSACESAWQDIQAIHPEIPDVVMIVGPDTSRGAQTLRKLGHFWADRWDVEETATPEVLLVGEALNRSPEDIFGTILHESAHALAFARKIQDTDKSGKRHNKHFKRLAEEVGLDVAESHRVRGYAFTSVPEDTLNRYSETVDKLRDALSLYRVPVGAKGTKPSRNLLKATCDCGRVIRIAKATFEVAAITCQDCETDFQLAE